MPDDTFGRVADDELANIVETTSRENDVERPYTWGLIRSALLELQQHRARIAAHAAAHPERLSEKVLESISTTLSRDTQLMIGSDMTRAEGRAAIAEIQQRRAEDLTHDQLIAIRRARSILTGVAISMNNIDRPEYARIVAALGDVLSAHGVTP